MAGPVAVPMDGYEGVVLVTVCYVIMYYWFMGQQVMAKVLREKQGKFSRYTATDQLWIFSDRCFLNTVEQSPMFLTLLWLNAIFIDAQTTAKLGAFYLVMRMAFPFFWASKGEWNLNIEISTQSNYLVIHWWWWQLGMKALLGHTMDTYASMLSDHWIVYIPIIIGVHTFITIFNFVAGGILCSLTFPPFNPGPEWPMSFGDPEPSKEPSKTK